MSGEQKSIDLSEIVYEQQRFDLSEASILLDPQKPQLSSHIKKEVDNDTANIETRCDKKEEPYAGSFMRDLMKFEKEVSYESDVYDIYQGGGTSTSEYRDRAHKILIQSKQQQGKSVNQYIYDFGKRKLHTSRKGCVTPKIKTCTSSPKSPRRQQATVLRVPRTSEACQQYYGYETPKSQQPQLSKKKHSTSSKKLKSTTRLLQFDISEPQRSLSKLSAKSYKNLLRKTKK